MIDIKAIKAAAEADTECPHEHYEVPMSEVQSSVLIALCDEVERLRKDAERYRWLVEYLVSDRTDQDDAIVAVSAIGVDQVTAVIDAAMESKT